MKATLETKELREAVNSCVVAINRRALLPICGYVLVEVDSKVAVLKTTDLTHYITASVPCSVSEPFKVLIPYKSFSQFVSKGDGEITIESVGNSATLERPHIGRLNLLNLPKVSEFPPPPENRSSMAYSGSKRGLQDDGAGIEGLRLRGKPTCTHGDMLQRWEYGGG